MQIDFMRNYTKYFPKQNIEEIEKTAIGKKSNDVHNLSLADSINKKQAMLQSKKSLIIKSKMKKAANSVLFLEAIHKPSLMSRKALQD